MEQQDKYRMSDRDSGICLVMFRLPAGMLILLPRNPGKTLKLLQKNSGTENATSSLNIYRLEKTKIKNCDLMVLSDERPTVFLLRMVTNSQFRLNKKIFERFSKIMISVFQFIFLDSSILRNCFIEFKSCNDDLLQMFFVIKTSKLNN